MRLRLNGHDNLPPPPPLSAAALSRLNISIPNCSLLDLMDHPDIWGPWFRSKADWQAWRAFLSALFGLAMTPAALNIYRQCTGRKRPPSTATNEAWLVVGRRGGKSRMLALIAVYLAIFRDWSLYLAPGEVGTIKCIATDRSQARIMHRYCRAFLKPAPFARLVQRETDDEITLTTGISIEIQTASFRAVRGYTVIACLLDETAFWRTDENSVNVDEEILAAIRPAMATIPGAMLLAASSPYARRGILWRAYRQHYGHDDSPALCWHAPTLTMNPTDAVRQYVDKQYQDDPVKASAEFGAEFRTDIESFISREVVEAALIPGRYELPPQPNTHYVAFVDPSGGSGDDSMTLAIAHRDADGNAILDAIRERRPQFSPEHVANEFSNFMKSYHIGQVTGDHFGGDWPPERFRLAGIHYNPSRLPKSQIYLEALPLLNSSKVELLDNERLLSQLLGLERRTARSGKDSIDHAPGGHDDLVNAAMGALTLAIDAKHQPMIISDQVLTMSRLPSAYPIRYTNPGGGITAAVLQRSRSRY